MGVIVVVCAAFDLIVSEAKTEIVCLSTKGMPEALTTFSVEAAGNVYNETNEFAYLGRTSTTTPTCSPRLTGAHVTHGADSGVHPLSIRPTERSPRAQNSDAKSRGTPDNVVRLRHMEPARVPL